MKLEQSAIRKKHLRGTTTAATTGHKNNNQQQAEGPKSNISSTKVCTRPRLGWYMPVHSTIKPTRFGLLSPCGTKLPKIGAKMTLEKVPNVPGANAQRVQCVCCDRCHANGMQKTEFGGKSPVLVPRSAQFAVRGEGTSLLCCRDGAQAWAVGALCKVKQGSGLKLFVGGRLNAQNGPEKGPQSPQGQKRATSGPDAAPKVPKPCPPPPPPLLFTPTRPNTVHRTDDWGQGLVTKLANINRTVRLEYSRTQ